MEKTQKAKKLFKQLFIIQIFVFSVSILATIIDPFIEKISNIYILAFIAILLLVSALAAYISQVVTLIKCRSLNKLFHISFIVTIIGFVLSVVPIFINVFVKVDILQTILSQTRRILNIVIATLTFYGILNISKEEGNNTLTAIVNKSAPMYVILASISCFGNIFTGISSFDTAASIIVIMMEIFTYCIYLNILYKSSKLL